MVKDLPVIKKDSITKNRENESMNKLQEDINNKIDELNKMIIDIQQSLDNAPEGAMSVSHNGNYDQYYLRTVRGDTHGKYIRKNQKELIRALAQKDYCQKLLPIVVTEKEFLQQCMNNYHPDKISEIYDRLSHARKQLVQPYILPDDEFLAQWLQKNYPAYYTPKADEDAIYTENGEAVRSKSEKILADKFKMKNIPYHYEKPLYLQGYGTIHPDFTVLNTRTRQEYYWEHLGLMDKQEYCEKAIKKIESLARNRIFPGKNLILTYETSTHPLNMKTVELMIKEYLT